MANTKKFKGKNLNLILAIGVIAVVFIILSMSGCISSKTPGNETTNATNITTNITTNVIIADIEGVAKAGDTVEVNYVLRLENGTIFDESEGKPLQFTTGAGKIIKGFDEAVIGMKINETKNVTIPPEKSYGNYDPTKIQTIPKVRVVSRFMDIPLDGFKQATGKDPVINDTYQIPNLAPWPVKVIEIKNTTITIRHEPLPDMVIDTGLGEVTAVTFNDTNLTLTSNPVIGTKISTQSGVAIIVGVDNTTIMIDTNHPLAGKTLNFEITLVGILDECDAMGISKRDKPEVNVFVMSYCPYGTQIEKGIIPVQELLGSKADINIRFVQYTMHGQKEADENTRQYCIDKEQKDKFWQYLACFLDKGDSAGCLDKVGVDKDKLQSCATSADAEFGISSDMASGAQYPRYGVHESLAKKYGVGGSPTLVINDITIQTSRDSESLKKAICCAFNEKPAECSQALNSSAPSPGFGFTGGGGGSAGSCG